MNLKSIEGQVVNLTTEVGKFIRNEGLAFDRSRIEFKDGFNNLVSYVDKEAEHKLVESLRKILPNAGFVAEEGTGTREDSGEYNWLIDPLDGTTNFMHGLPVYAISVALARKDKIVLGIVYEINRDECFYSTEGHPAYCNGKKISISKTESLNESLLATGFPYFHSEKKEIYLEIIKTFLDKTHGIRRLGSAAIDLAYVACGRLDGFFEYNLNPWDVAAGTFIVQQAGGSVTDFNGGENFLYGGELIAAGRIHPEMLGVVKTMWFNKKPAFPVS